MYDAPPLKTTVFEMHVVWRTQVLEGEQSPATVPDVVHPDPAVNLWAYFTL